MSLPPSQFEGPEDSGGLLSHYDAEVWDYDITAYIEAYSIVDEWASGSGFTTGEWMDSITDVRNFDYNDEGNLESFDFDFETDDGYSGSRHAH